MGCNIFVFVGSFSFSVNATIKHREIVWINNDLMLKLGEKELLSQVFITYLDSIHSFINFIQRYFILISKLIFNRDRHFIVILITKIIYVFS